MTTELRKRLEVLTEKACLCMSCTISECRANRIACHKYINFRNGAISGAELGYKEAIAQAKKWLKEYYHLFDHFDKDEVLADFEADMNKLLD